MDNLTMRECESEKVREFLFSLSIFETGNGRVKSMKMAHISTSSMHRFLIVSLSHFRNMYHARTVMAIFTFFLITLVFSHQSAGQNLNSGFSARTLLDIEKSNGFEVTPRCYQVLDSIFIEAKNTISFKPAPSKDAAIEICKTISTILENKFGITFNETCLLSEGLSNKYLDCNFYSILFYDILAKQYGYKVFPVASPGHMFIRWYISDGDYFNYETTQKEVVEDSEYVSLFHISAQAIENKIYLQPLDDQQLLATNYVEMANAKPQSDIAAKRMLCNKSLQLDASGIFGRIMNGYIYVLTEKYDSAITYYNELLTSDSLNYVIAGEIAIMYSLQKDHKMAVRYYTRAITINPIDPQLYINRSREYLRVNNVEQAMSDFDGASALLNNKNLFSFIFNYLALTELEQDIMEKYLELNEKK